MKLKNESLAGQKISSSSGDIEIGADGVVDVDNDKWVSILKNSGFKPVFARKDAPIAKKEQPKTEPEVVVKPTFEEPKAKREKGRRR